MDPDAAGTLIGRLTPAGHIKLQVDTHGHVGQGRHRAPVTNFASLQNEDILVPFWSRFTINWGAMPGFFLRYIDRDSGAIPEASQGPLQSALGISWESIAEYLWSTIMSESDPPSGSLFGSVYDLFPGSLLDRIRVDIGVYFRTRIGSTFGMPFGSESVSLSDTFWH